MLKSIELKAKIENFEALSTWISNTAASWNLNNLLMNKINICLEEIFVNISSYAYKNQIGLAKISIDKNDNENEIILIFEDEGVKYNPLLKNDPDITLSYDERPIGGLGIYMVKEMANDVEYKRINNKNQLTLKFKID